MIPLRTIHRHLTHRIVALVVTCATVLCGIPTDAYAATGNIFSPFDIGTSWYVCQGYDGPVTHSGSDRYALDLTTQLCDGSASANSSSAGATVRSPVSGRTNWYSPSYGALCINTTDGRSIALIHIDSSLTSSGISLVAGQSVGSVASAGRRGNGGIAHLHIQMWSQPDCYNNRPVPFDSADNARICGAPDMTTAGPNTYNNGTWSGTKFTASDCAPSPAPPMSGYSAVYRFWSSTNKHHFYTSSYEEMRFVYDHYDDATWKYEGYVYYAPSNDGGAELVPVYRFWSDEFKGHFYTASEDEKNATIANYPPSVWKYEGIAYYAFKDQGNPLNQRPVYRFWSDEFKGHFYTASEDEKNATIANYPPSVWKYEGIAYYVAT